MITKRGAEAAEEAFHEELWAYAGRRFNGKQEQDRFYTYHEVGEKGAYVATATGHSFETKKSKRFTVGGVYAVQVCADGSRAVVNGAQFKYMLSGSDHADLILSWKAEHDAARFTQDALKLEAKGDELPFEILEPLRAVYWRSMPMRQAAIEVAVLRYLRRAPKR